MGGGLGARAARTGRARGAQDPLEQAAEGARAAHRVEEVGPTATIGLLTVVELAQYPVAGRAGVVPGGPGFGRMRPAHQPRPDRAECRRCRGDLLRSFGDGERSGRRRRPAGRGPIDEAAHRRGEDVLVGGERPVTFDGEVPGHGRRAPIEVPHDAGREASGGQQRGLYPDGTELRRGHEGTVDVDDGAIGPRGLAGRGRCHRQRYAGDGGGEKIEAGETVRRSWASDRPADRPGGAPSGSDVAGGAPRCDGRHVPPTLPVLTCERRDGRARGQAVDPTFGSPYRPFGWAIRGSAG